MQKNSNFSLRILDGHFLTIYSLAITQIIMNHLPRCEPVESICKYEAFIKMPKLPNSTPTDQSDLRDSETALEISFTYYIEIRNPTHLLINNFFGAKSIAAQLSKPFIPLCRTPWGAIHSDSRTMASCGSSYQTV